MKKNRTGTELHAFRIEWLTTFLQVVESGGYEAKATKPLGISASAVNRHIASLETWLQKLVFTNDYPKELTKFGKEFETTAQTILQHLEQAQQLSSQPRPEQSVSARNIDMSQYTKKGTNPS